MSFQRLVERRRALRLQKQAKRAAAKVRFPKGFKGAVMWCPLCYAELRRVPDGEKCSPEEQQRIVAEHRAICARPKMKAV